jgi:tRNA A-37 threonylcarbamoyl transferase component Bud32
MAFLEVNPRYQTFLQQQGLTTPTAFLEIPSIIICGHPDRNVARVTLGKGPGVIAAFLKREHHVRWKERVLNAMAGFGFLSKSSREAAVLRSLQQAGIGCPDWIAVGEDSQGRAFLLLRELTGVMELRLFLQDYRDASADQRRRIAHKLGEALADFHNAGFDHPDLYSKHILVNPGDLTVYFLDCQRSRRWRQVAWRRWRDLAALAATLADDLATIKEQLVCLRAYLRKSRGCGAKRQSSLRSAASSIGHLASRLLRQRRIRELRKVPAPNHAQGLIWQDGEALCLTPEFQADLAGHIPDWLGLANLPRQPGSWEKRAWVELPESRHALLIRRRQSRLLGGLWDLLRRRRQASPELRQAGLLLRLERYGIRTCRLLAFGQRCGSCRSVESFLLVEPPPGAVGLGRWLARNSAELAQRRRLIREAACLLRRIHDLHYYFGGSASFAFVPSRRGSAESVLGSIDGLYSRRRPSNSDAWKDLAALHRELSSSGCGRTDGLRLLLSYLGLRKPNAAAKHLARALLPRRHPATAAREVHCPSSIDGLRLRTAEQGTLS